MKCTVYFNNEAIATFNTINEAIDYINTLTYPVHGRYYIG